MGPIETEIRSGEHHFRKVEMSSSMTDTGQSLSAHVLCTNGDYES